MVSLSLSDDGGSVALRVGETASVRLPENASTGYRWAPDRLDAERLELTAAEADYHGGAVGSGGDAVFVLRAKKPGSAEASFKYWRHWEGESSVRERFGVRIEIRP